MSYNSKKELICSQIQDAINNKQDIIISYKKYDGTISERRISNVQFEHITIGYYDYIIGHCHMRQAERTFKINEIISLKIVWDSKQIKFNIDDELLKKRNDERRKKSLDIELLRRKNESFIRSQIERAIKEKRDIIIRHKEDGGINDVTIVETRLSNVKYEYEYTLNYKLEHIIRGYCLSSKIKKNFRIDSIIEVKVCKKYNIILGEYI